MRRSRWAVDEVKHASGRLRGGAVGALLALAACQLAACQLATAAPPARLANERGDAPPRYRDGMPAPPPLPSLPTPSLTSEPPGPLASRPSDQLWMVSCRGLKATDREHDFTRLAYWRYVTPSGWVASTRDAYLMSGGSVSGTSVFVPGNGYTSNQARDLGGVAYRRLVAAAPSDPLRFVIWSWPSDHINAGPVQDARVKATRTTLAAWYLARWLDDLEPLGNVSIIGCSFGARVVGEALQLRGGGRLGSYQLTEPAATRSPLRVVLVSAAIDNDWLLPGHRLGRALTHVERMLLVNNTSDSILRRYGWLYGRRNAAAALGYTGLIGTGRLGHDASKVRQIDATSIVGRRHGFLYYFSVPRIVGWMQPYVFTTSGSAASEIAAQQVNHRRSGTSARSPVSAANR